MAKNNMITLIKNIKIKYLQKEKKMHELPLRKF